MPKCPHCDQPIDVRFIKAPPMQSQQQGRIVPDNADIGSLLEQINDDDLDSASSEFVSQTRERFAQYGDRTKMSEKQMAWLRKLAAGIPR